MKTRTKIAAESALGIAFVCAVTAVLAVVLGASPARAVFGAGTASGSLSGVRLDVPVDEARVRRLEATGAWKRRPISADRDRVPEGLALGR